MELLEEAFSNATYMDVTELRQMYYGRSNLYVSFTDSINYIKSGKDSGSLVRPWSILANTVNEVVARKVSTPYFYANVIRIDKKGWLDDIRHYDDRQLKKDVETLTQLSFLDESFINTIVEYVMERKRGAKKFEILWEITKRLSKNNEMTWNKILVGIGYTGFTDQTGTGLFGTRFPQSIILTEDALTYLDTVAVQKYRTDNRKRVKERIEQVQRVSMSATKKNRIAKVQNRRRG